ncbi:MAG: nicotinate-nucleotide--dimethylbenzimidazole phosphoribosyltransferase [Actinomycetota bacterium]|nr:nicotinate-nucleotide--dimethylbenzimidazole phosphoribosyltransferase [Actinomycetota bacterium]
MIAMDEPLDLDALAETVGVPDEDARAAAAQLQGRLTKPTGALGRLEDVSLWIAAVQGRCPPRIFQRPRVVVFCGDHGVAKAGVSAYPPEVTGQMVANLLAGGAAANVLARRAGAGVRVVDLSVDAEAPAAPPETTRYKVRRSSGRIDVEDALTDAEAQLAFRNGMAIADDEIDSGADLLIAGDMGIGNTTPAAVLVSVVTGAEPASVVGRGSGIDDTTWMRKAAAVRDACRRARPYAGDPLGLLRTAAGADLTAMTGFLVQAAARRTPVILDGVAPCAAAVVAGRITPHAPLWQLAGHRSTEPAQQRALQHLELEPLLDLGLRLGEGTGALVALPIVTAAVATLAEMATFDSAGVSNREPHG